MIENFLKGLKFFLKDSFEEHIKPRQRTAYNSVDGCKYDSDHYFILDLSVGVDKDDHSIWAIFCKETLHMVGELSHEPSTKMYDYRNLVLPKNTPRQITQVEKEMIEISLIETMEGLKR